MSGGGTGSGDEGTQQPHKGSRRNCLHFCAVLRWRLQPVTGNWWFQALWSGHCSLRIFALWELRNEDGRRWDGERDLPWQPVALVWDVGRVLPQARPLLHCPSESVRPCQCRKSQKVGKKHFRPKKKLILGMDKEIGQNRTENHAFVSLKVFGFDKFTIFYFGFRSVFTHGSSLWHKMPKNSLKEALDCKRPGSNSGIFCTLPPCPWLSSLPRRRFASSPARGRPGHTARRAAAGLGEGRAPAVCRWRAPSEGCSHRLSAGSCRCSHAAGETLVRLLINSRSVSAQMPF